MVLLALFGAVMGQGVIWYTGQFYAQSFLETVCKIDFLQSRNIILVAIAFATPFFVFFGWLSDRIGRKWIMMIGMLAGVIAYLPIYTHLLDLTSANALSKIMIQEGSGLKESVAKFDKEKPSQLLLVQKFDTLYSDGSAFHYTKTDTLNLGAAYNPTSSNIAITKPDGNTLTATLTTNTDLPLSAGTAPITAAAIGAKPHVLVEKTLGDGKFWTIVFLVFIQIIFVTMVYGPIAAFLVELFPTKIRYTSMSLPYHVGNGVFGGLVPFLATLIVEFTKTAENPAGNPLAGLWYPIGVAAVCFVIGSIYLTNKIDRNVMD